MASEKKNETIFGQETEFEGNLTFSDSLVITGKFNGNINATGDLEIEKSAVCNVDKMTAATVVVSGRVNGNIEASKSVELCKGSKVKGDITTPELRIADNVEFEGSVNMLDEIPDTDIFSISSDEYKKSLVLKNSEFN
ncbi:MAG: polymer-forming cytoskeletal protein [Treponema sp.]|nr:polymer-forming cytoskeletal protein [Treponema sp.]MBP5575539.1 polymer-forming cytoskeletal protein [Treponema sp.]MBP5747625.1 polymer-forming cytoskeletal protein [Treponema sp.]MBR0126406.1 polymer-forming cytoskeletal protein [Treponema sp.]